MRFRSERAGQLLVGIASVVPSNFRKLLVVILSVAVCASIAFIPAVGEPSTGCLLLELRVSGSTNDILLTWDERPWPQSYCVERGDLGVLRATGGNFTVSLRQELASHTTETSLIFSGTPELGEGYWFLLRDNPVGTFDTGCPSQVDSRDDEILGAGDFCVN